MQTPTEKSRYHAIGKWGRGRVRAVDLTPRDLDYLHALFTTGTLSTEMLHALVSPKQSQRITTDRIFLLKNPPNDFVVQPKGQENSKGANYTSLAYEISERGVSALVDAGRIAYADYVLWKKLQANYKPQHFDHDCATGYILGSFQLGAREVGIRFISWLEILTRQRCPRETRDATNPIAIPFDAHDGRRCLIPDALFGLEYPSGACFFALETDMGTEQLSDNKLKNATITQKFRSYRAIIRHEIHRTRYGLPSLQVLIVTPSIVRMQNIMETLARHAACDPNWATRAFHFKAVPELVRRSGVSLRPNGHLLTAQWNRTLNGIIVISCLQ